MIDDLIDQEKNDWVLIMNQTQLTHYKMYLMAFTKHPHPTPPSPLGPFGM